MSSEKTFRYVVLLSLMIVSVVLFIYYHNLSNTKASIIQLCSFYPYNRHDLLKTEQAFDNLAHSNCYGFFQDQKTLKNLTNKSIALQASQDTLEMVLNGVEERIWKSEGSPFQFYNKEISIPDKHLTIFYKSVKEYIDAFKIVLKQTHWKASADYEDIYTYDIQIDTRPSIIALEELERFLSHDEIITIQTKKYDLRRLTLFELFVVLEQIRWYRYNVESTHLETLSKQREKWVTTIKSKICINNSTTK